MSHLDGMEANHELATRHRVKCAARLALLEGAHRAARAGGHTEAALKLESKIECAEADLGRADAACDRSAYVLLEARGEF